MDAVLDMIARVMGWLGDMAFGLLSPFSVQVALWIISALTGILMLLIWRYTSNQNAIKDVRNKISANLLASRLFKDNLAVTFRAERQIVWQSIRLLGYSFQPMIIMLVPFVLVMVQIALRYEFIPAVPGEVMKVTATLKDKQNIPAGSIISLPAGVTHDSHDPCRVKALRTVDWRLTPSEAGEYAIQLGNEQEGVSVPLVAGDSLVKLSPMRGGGFWDRLLYSGEPSIPDESIFESVKVHYESRTTPILGIEMHWLISLLVLSIVFALIFKPFMKVHI